MPPALAPEMLTLFTVRPPRCQSPSGSRGRAAGAARQRGLGAALWGRYPCSSVPYQAGDLARQQERGRILQQLLLILHLLFAGVGKANAWTVKQKNIKHVNSERNKACTERYSKST